MRIGGSAASVLIGVVSLARLVGNVTSGSGWGAWAFILGASLNALVISAQSASTHGSDLWVRNYGWRRVIPRSSIVVFIAEPMVGPTVAKRIMVVVRGRKHPIILRASVRGPIDTESVEEWLIDLNHWLRTPVA